MRKDHIASFYADGTTYESTISLALVQWRKKHTQNIPKIVHNITYTTHGMNKMVRCLKKAELEIDNNIVNLGLATQKSKANPDRSHVYQMGLLFSAIITEDTMSNMSKEVNGAGENSTDFLKEFCELRCREIYAYLIESRRLCKDVLKDVENFIDRSQHSDRNRFQLKLRDQIKKRFEWFWSHSTWPYYYFTIENNKNHSQMITRIPSIATHNSLFSQRVFNYRRQFAREVLYPTFCFHAKRASGEKPDARFDLGWLIPRIPKVWTENFPLGLHQILNVEDIATYRTNLFSSQSQAAMFDFYMFNRSAMTVPIMGKADTLDGLFYLCSSLGDSFKDFMELLSSSRRKTKRAKSTEWIADEWDEAGGHAVSRLLSSDYHRRYITHDTEVDRYKKERGLTQSAISTTVHEIKSLVNVISNFSDRVERNTLNLLDEEKCPIKSDCLERVLIDCRNIHSTAAVMSAASKAKIPNFQTSSDRYLNHLLNNNFKEICNGSIGLLALWSQVLYSEDLDITFHKAEFLKNSIRELAKVLKVSHVLENDPHGQISLMMEKGASHPIVSDVIISLLEVFSNWRHTTRFIPICDNTKNRKLCITIDSLAYKNDFPVYRLKQVHRVKGIIPNILRSNILPPGILKLNSKYGRAGHGFVEIYSPRFIEYKEEGKISYTFNIRFGPGISRKANT